jgi:hypothetical protein
MLYWVNLAWEAFELTTLVVIGIDCIGSCKSNYQTIMTKTAPEYFRENFIFFKTAIYTISFFGLILVVYRYLTFLATLFKYEKKYVKQ